MRMVFLFAWSGFRQWAGYLTGGVAAALLLLYERIWHQQVPPWIFYVFVLGGLLFSAPRAWQEEHQRANRFEYELARL